MKSPQIDYWVERSKWTVATLALISVPVTAIVFLQYLWRALGSPIYLLMFCLGLGIVVYLAKRPIANSYWVRKSFRWLHDTTQSLAIQIILHPLASLQSAIGRYQSIRNRFRRSKGVEVIPPANSPFQSDGKAGSRTYQPGDEWLARDNWVLLATPYTLPLSTLLFWLPSLILFAPLRSATLGIGLGVHLGYVYYHWRRQSLEIRQLGERFCWMYLPAANFLVASIVFAFAIGGFAGVWNFMVDWITLPWDTASMVWNWFLPTTLQEQAK